jgi:hypothetical protein
MSLKARIRLLVLVALAIPVVSAVVLVRSYAAPWPERLPHVRLEPSRPVLKEADVRPDNAYCYIRQLTSSFATNSLGAALDEHTRFEALGAKEAEYPLLAQWAAQNADALTLCLTAAAMTNCQIVTPTNFYESSLGYLGPVRNMVRALRFRAEVAASRGDWPSAVRDFRAALMLGTDVAKGGPLINHLVGYACVGITSSSLRRTALEYSVPSEKLRKMIALLDEAESSQEPYAEAMRYERVFGLSALDLAYRQPAAIMPLIHMTLVNDVDTNRFWACVNWTPLIGPLGSTPAKTARHFDGLYSHLIDIAGGGLCATAVRTRSNGLSRRV